jgi:pimeloyl-ACP methyl ester carboxylesterase
MVTESESSRFVQAGKLKIHYHDLGQGEPVIMLHGAGPGASAWSNFKQNVDAFSSRFRTLLVDSPQYGQSDKVVIEGGRLTFLAGFLRDFMDALQLKSALFVGNSMGGQAAIKLAIDAPERVKKLVLIGSTPVLTSLFCPLPLEGIKQIGAYYRGNGPSMEKMETLLRTILYDSSFLNDETLKERYEATLDPEAIKVFSAPPPLNEDLSSELHKVTCPSLLVWGADDRFGALDIGLLMLRKFQNSRMHIFNHCGHWAQVEHAEEFNRVVIDFLEEAR